MAPSCFIEPPVCRFYNINQRGKSSYAANPRTLSSPTTSLPDLAPLGLHYIIKKVHCNYTVRINVAAVTSKKAPALLTIIILFKELWLKKQEDK